jgi:hypothetical protein
MQPCTHSSTKPIMTNAQSDGATSSMDASPRPGDEQSPITTTNNDWVTFSTQHFGPAKQLTKYGQPFAPSGSAETENCTGKTTKNNELSHYVLHKNQYNASTTSQRIKFQKQIPTLSMHNQSKRSSNGQNATWMHTQQQPKCTWSKTLTPVKSTPSLHHNLRGCNCREVYDSAIVQLNQHL